MRACTCTALADFGNLLKPDILNSGLDTIESSILIKKISFIKFKHNFYNKNKKKYLHSNE